MKNLATKNPKRTYVKGKYGTAQFVANLTPKMKATQASLDEFHEKRAIVLAENPDATPRQVRDIIAELGDSIWDVDRDIES